jgi:hypothetical protein
MPGLGGQIWNISRMEWFIKTAYLNGIELDSRTEILALNVSREIQLKIIENPAQVLQGQEAL